METIYILYRTTNLVNDKTYIGIHKTNNLDDGYIGSGKALLNAVKKYGKERFKREILEFCNSYDELLELEKLYVNIDWIKDESNYNLKTGGQSSGILSDESKKKISDTLKERYKNDELDRRESIAPYNITDEIKEKISKTLTERYKEQEHNRKEVNPWNKGLKGVQVGWNKGLKLKPMTEEEKEKRSKTLKERWKNQEHHSKGQEPWNKGKKGSQVAWNKGKEMEKIECPYCHKFFDKLNAKKWHFENCKLKN
jgi:hypothetical protein